MLGPAIAMPCLWTTARTAAPSQGSDGVSASARIEGARTGYQPYSMSGALILPPFCWTNCREVSKVP